MVEQGPEEPRVVSSILTLGTRTLSSAGQSASFTPRMSWVRIPQRPPMDFTMFKLTHLLQIDYWLNSSLNYTFTYFWIVVAVFGIFFILSLVLNLIPKIKQINNIESLISWLRWLTFCALILLFWRYQSLPLFNLRIWWILAMFGFSFWLWQIIRKAKLMVIPLETQTKRYQTFEKYLPRSKGREPHKVQ